MTPAALDALRHLPLFPATAEELIQVAGLSAAARLISAWPAQEFPVPARVGGGTARGALRYEQLVEIVGAAAAARIIARWRGLMLYIPSCKEVAWSAEQDAIRAAYDRLTADGWSHPEAVFELGIRHRIAGRSVERALSRPDNPPPPPPRAAAQMNLF